MRLETRRLDGGRKKFVILVVETELESTILDREFGNRVGRDGHLAWVKGEIKLADGYAEHYIRLEAGEEYGNQK